MVSQGGCRAGRGERPEPDRADTPPGFKVGTFQWGLLLLYRPTRPSKPTAAWERCWKSNSLKAYVLPLSLRRKVIIRTRTCTRFLFERSKLITNRAETSVHAAALLLAPAAEPERASLSGNSNGRKRRETTFLRNGALKAWLWAPIWALEVCFDEPWARVSSRGSMQTARRLPRPRAPEGSTAQGGLPVFVPTCLRIDSPGLLFAWLRL